jgi:ribosomal protein S18 acetylase RimI-like enzyme
MSGSRGDWSLEAGVTMRVRKIGPDDWVVWRLLRQRSLTEDPQAFAASVDRWTGDQDREENWRSRLAEPGSSFVAEHGAAPVGLVGMRPDSDDDGLQLTSMWVATSARGRGVGRALVGRVIAEAAGRPLWLRVLGGNETAIRLYQRCGFVLDDTDPDAEGCRAMRLVTQGEVSQVREL